MACDKWLTFNNGLKMPALGIGTWQAPDDEVEAALNLALEAGYRHIDAAPVYMNEKTIGRVLKEWLDSGRVKREELFITTKLPPPALIPEYVEPTLRNSLADLQLDYVDLYLLHTPFGVLLENGEFKRDENGIVVVEPNTDHIAVWKKMEHVLELGLTKSIGLSNFNVKQIDRLLNNCKTRPANLQAPDDEVEAALNLALEAGYRHIDAAPVYMNEKTIGRVLKEWLDSGRVKREELFITTKLPPPALIPEYVEPTLRNSLADLQLDYVDLYLLHTPFGVLLENGEFKRDENGIVVVEPNTDHIAVWKKMEHVLELGLTKSIGLSNFNVKQIDRLLNNCKTRPANLQIEHHVYLQQPELVDFCKKEDIIVTAYSPLGSRGIAGLNKMAGIERELPDLMDIPEVKEIAEAHGKTPAQVLLRWIIDCGLSAIPKSTNAERLKQNLDIFDFKLTDEEIDKMRALDANVRICDFKFFPGVEKHPEFPF